ncbi:MAG: 2Fe-2S iron-sulfur cluster binding domain-containing protein [Bdellovibrio sp.]|nr:2Fe-2S iron-sulfur cluster binding domain-containing protein [Bdellovibrio sp.]
MADSTKTLKIYGQNAIIFFKANENLLDVLNDNKISINQSCGANGSCTTCRVFVRSDESCFSERSEIEIERTEERSFAENERLACQTYLLDSATIEIPEDDIF